MKTRKELIAGVRYKGYGVINEFGEFEFTPENTGSQQGRQKVLKSGEDFTISETRTKLLVRLVIRKQKTQMENIFAVARIFDKVLKIFRSYEI